MYRTLNSLLNSSTGALPSCTSNESLSNNFAYYFTEKVSKIRSELDDHCVLNNVNNSTSLVKCMYSVCTNNSNVNMLSTNTECNKHPAVSRFNKYLQSNDLTEELQSA